MKFMCVILLSKFLQYKLCHHDHSIAVQTLLFRTSFKQVESPKDDGRGGKHHFLLEYWSHVDDLHGNFSKEGKHDIMFLQFYI